MEYTDEDISIFADLIQANDISVADAIDWAYSQYTDVGVEPWIEELSLALDKKEVLEILRKNFNFNENISNEALAGKVAHDYFQKRTGLQETISRLLFDILIDTDLDQEKTNLYVAEDYFGWHQNPEVEALKVARPILEKYSTKYEQARRKFSA
jgi:hypothetical protein